MTQYLTKLWKERKLKEGIYYIHVHLDKELLPPGCPVFDEKVPKYYDGDDFEEYERKEIKEILAKVPSYSEYSKLKRKARFSK